MASAEQIIAKGKQMSTAVDILLPAGNRDNRRALSIQLILNAIEIGNFAPVISNHTITF